MGVSKNSGTPKSSILRGFSIINLHFRVPLFLETRKWWWDGYNFCSASVRAGPEPEVHQWHTLGEAEFFSKNKQVPPKFWKKLLLLGGGNSNVLYVHPYLGEDEAILTIIFFPYGSRFPPKSSNLPYRKYPLPKISWYNIYTYTSPLPPRST